jgi:hypothetical protein
LACSNWQWLKFSLTLVMACSSCQALYKPRLKSLIYPANFKVILKASASRSSAMSNIEQAVQAEAGKAQAEAEVSVR